VGVKVVVGDGEPLTKALRRLKKELDRDKPRYPRRQEVYKPAEVRRRKKNNRKLKARQAGEHQRILAGVAPFPGLFIYHQLYGPTSTDRKYPPSSVFSEAKS
jgi:ribosomal protein S21